MNGPARDIAVFNGDADGLCALRQLALAEGLDPLLVTGCKREIELLGRVTATATDRLTVLDVSLDRNRVALEAALSSGASVRYFDHHFPGVIPVHPRLLVRIDTSGDTCTSVLVDRFVQGRFRRWAITGAYGDNLVDTAEHLADTLALAPADRATLRALGESLNYNAYGDRVEDLRIHPADLYRRLAAFDDPLAFARTDPVADALSRAREADLALALAVAPRVDAEHCVVVELPAAPWSRRVLGAMAHHVAGQRPQRACAVLAPSAVDTYAVSLRVPPGRATDAHSIARRFGGGGRAGAAGIDGLPAATTSLFINAFVETTRPVTGA